MTVFVILFIIDMVIAVMYAREGHPVVNLKSFWYKMLASGIFVANGVLSYLHSDKEKYSVLVLVALVLGLIGDAFLSFEPFVKGENEKRNMMIATVVGALFFLAGHICYILAFVEELHIRRAFNLKIFLLAWAAIMLLAVIVKIALRAKLGKLGFPMLIYALGLSAMGAQSICLSLLGFAGNVPMQLLFFTAPLLFIISDSTLGLKFSDNERFGSLKIRMVTLITYYAAQMLFGLTIQLV